MPVQPDRQMAWELLCRYNDSEALRRHALAVEGTMRHFARKLAEDEGKWGVIGLLHDLDYEKWPDQHCEKVVELMQAEDIDPDYIHAVISHGWGLRVETAPEHVMEKVLYTIDELTGLINAAAIMRPSKSVMDLELKSVKKKYKDKKFAAGVNREVIEKGCALLGMPLDDVIQETILGMREVAGSIGLAGNEQ